MPQLDWPAAGEPVGQLGAVQDQLLPVLLDPVLVPPWAHAQAQMIDSTHRHNYMDPPHNTHDKHTYMENIFMNSSRSAATSSTSHLLLADINTQQLTHI